VEIPYRIQFVKTRRKAKTSGAPAVRGLEGSPDIQVLKVLKYLITEILLSILKSSFDVDLQVHGILLL
jgi:hypothetical protein